MTASPLPSPSTEDNPTPYPLVDRARNSLRQAIDRYIPQLQLTNLSSEELQRQANVKAGIDQLTSLMNKLDSTLLRVAVFGLVSRGKSAVLNALVGEKILETGPLNGVTQWPRSIYWQPTFKEAPQTDTPQTNTPQTDTPQTNTQKIDHPNTKNSLKIELIDTPGLDEIEGAERSKVAQEIARQADLILFVVAGDITRTEYKALRSLYKTHKPLILVFNKIDLYPDSDRDTVSANLQQLWNEVGDLAPLNNRLVDDIVMVAADPTPMQVRVEWPNGNVTEEWETPPAQIDALKQTLLQIVQKDGPTLIALNALRQAGELEGNLATATTALNQTDADQLIWQFAKYKAMAVALNPIAVLDILGGVASDLTMIRSLAKLYGFPMTGFEASNLWRMIVRSSGTLILMELGSGLILGFGKTGAALLSMFDSMSGFTAYAGAMTAQAGAAGYGTYAVGQVARVYLEQGCTWGPQGVKTVMTDILAEAKEDSTLDRLKNEIREAVREEVEGGEGAERRGKEADEAEGTEEAGEVAGEEVEGVGEVEEAEEVGEAGEAEEEIA